MWILTVSSVLVLVAYLLYNNYTFSFSLQEPTSTPFNSTSSMSAKNIHLRPFKQLGREDHGGWLARYHFSFGGYFDRSRMSWGSLRVLNDDVLTATTDVPPHPHRSMEIVTYVHGQHWHPETGKIEGGIGVRHRDNKGSDGVIEPGDVQVMSVGSEGIVHAEYPAEPKDDSTSLSVFQLWILPDKNVKETTWGTRHFPRENLAKQFITFASGFKEDIDNGALLINSYSRVVGARLERNEPVKYHVDKNRLAYAVAIRGSFKINGLTLETHDGAAIEATEELTFESVSEDSEVLLIDTHP